MDEEFIFFIFGEGKFYFFEFFVFGFEFFMLVFINLVMFFDRGFVVELVLGID